MSDKRAKAKEVMEAVFWDQAQPKAETLGHLSDFNPASGNLPVLDTKGGAVTVEFGDRFAVDINGEMVGSVVVESSAGEGNAESVIVIKTTTGDRITLKKGLGLLARLGLE